MRVLPEGMSEIPTNRAPVVLPPIIGNERMLSKRDANKISVNFLDHENQNQILN